MSPAGCKPLPLVEAAGLLPDQPPVRCLGPERSPRRAAFGVPGWLVAGPLGVRHGRRRGPCRGLRRVAESSVERRRCREGRWCIRAGLGRLTADVPPVHVYLPISTSTYTHTLSGGETPFHLLYLYSYLDLYFACTHAPTILRPLPRALADYYYCCYYYY